jgi:hypothetical protein
MTRHVIQAEMVAVCPDSDMELLRQSVSITFDYTPGYRETHEEPGQNPAIEFVACADPHSLESAVVTAWGRWWLEENEAAALEFVADKAAADAEYRAEMRADDLRYGGAA